MKEQSFFINLSNHFYLVNGSIYNKNRVAQPPEA